MANQNVQAQLELKQTKEAMQKALTQINVLSAAASTKAASNGGVWDEADRTALQNAMNNFNSLKMQLSVLNNFEAMKDWAHGSDGFAVIPQTYGAAEGQGELLSWDMAGPLEGQPKGDAIIRQDWKSGELIAKNEAGARQLKALKSGIYEDALNRQLRLDALKGRFGGAEKFEMKDAHMKVLSEGSDAAGGAWVVPEFNSTLVKKIATMTTLRPNATSITVGSDSVSFPQVVYTTDDKYTSGVRFNWSAEAPSSDISESTNPSAGRPRIDIWTATAAIILTRANMEDAQFDILGLCSQLMSEAFALGENDAGWNGDGVGKMQGVLSHANATVAHSSGGMVVNSGNATALTWGTTDSTKGLIGLSAALPPQYDMNAKWFGSKATFAAVGALTDSQGRPLWYEPQQFPNYTTGQPAILLGNPVARDNFLPAIGANTYPLVRGDLSGYWIADRVGVEIAVLRELKALRDEVVIYARRRLGGVLMHDWRVKVQKVAA